MNPCEWWEAHRNLFRISVEHPGEQRPDALDAVGVNLAANVLLRVMLDHAVAGAEWGCRVWRGMEVVVWALSTGPRTGNLGPIRTDRGDPDPLSRTLQYSWRSCASSRRDGTPFVWWARAYRHRCSGSESRLRHTGSTTWDSHRHPIHVAGFRPRVRNGTQDRQGAGSGRPITASVKQRPVVCRSL